MLRQAIATMIQIQNERDFISYTSNIPKDQSLNVFVNVRNYNLVCSMLLEFLELGVTTLSEHWVVLNFATMHNT